MKKLLFITGLLLMAWTVPTNAQTIGKDLDKAARKVEREAKKAEEKMRNELLFREAERALKQHTFVLEADRVVFKRGRSAFVNSNMNFVSLEDERATVQIAFNGPYSGPNGLGGITVDGSASNIKMSQDKRGNINFSMNVSGIGVSAQVYIQLNKGANDATVTVSPNFNGNRMTLTGKLLPAEKSNVFKGRSI